MNTALSWIKAYVPDLTCTDQEYSDAMTLSGTKVETFERLDKNLEKIVIGQILKIEKHPDADKLIVCQVDIGNQTIQRSLAQTEICTRKPLKTAFTFFRRMCSQAPTLLKPLA